VLLGFAGGYAGELMTALPGTLAAICMGGAYMSALTYIGSAPSLMIYAMTVERGEKIPGFSAT
jgi:Na+/H+ antiporter NhaD/arsenite permease-like protein